MKKDVLILFVLSLAIVPLHEAIAQASTPWLQGYDRVVEGEYIGYRSAISDAGDAILVRSLKREDYIEWETEPIPKDFTGAYATFVWVASYDSTADRRQWTLEINDEEWFTFSNTPEPTWTLQGKQNAELSYQLTKLDPHGDYAGFQFLKVPVDAFVKGQPLRIRVTGESAGSRTWYMVFMSKLKPTLNLAAEPVLMQQGDQLLQRIRIDVTHDGDDVPVTFEIEGGEPVQEELHLGVQRFFIPVEAVDESTVKSVKITMGDQEPVVREVLVKPVRPFEIWFLPHSHVDIGYTHTQDEVLHIQWDNIEKGIDLAQRTTHYPDGAQYKWNVEGMWAVDEYLRQAPKAKQEALLDAIDKGWIGLDGLYGNLLTGLQRGEELFRATGENIHDLYDQHGLEVTSAMITDVPGYSWGLIPALAHNGIRYFSAGPNHMPALPHQGDRVGYTLEAWGDIPFWWQTPSGQDSVLFWMTAHGYSWFHGANLGDLNGESMPAVLQHLDELEEKGYPYDMVQLRYTIGGDNGPPDEAMPDFIRQWNETHISPKMRIATTAEMFNAFEAQYGDQLPTYRGDFTPYWEDGAGSTALETALNRNTADKLVQAEVLLAMNEGQSAPTEKLYEAWQKVALFSEHTWGAHNSISEPESEFVKKIWFGKQAFALEAAQLADALVNEALAQRRANAAPAEAVEITNTTSWPRTELVVIPWNRKGNLIKDAAGNTVPSQRLSTGALAFLSSDVPPMGSVVYTIHEGEPAASAGKGWASADGMSNGVLDVRFDSQTGAISSLKRYGKDRDLVNASHHRGLNQYFYSGLMAEDPRSNQQAKIQVLDDGPLVYTVRVESAAPGSHRLVQQIQLVEGMEQVAITNTVNKALIYEKENVRFAFPFNMPEATLRIDVPWTTVQPDAEQLTGSNKNYFSVQRFVDLSEDSFGLTWVTLDAPLVELDAMQGEDWMVDNTRPWTTEIGMTDLLYSWTMNNSWHTNYKAGQEGEATFRYVLRTHRGYDEAEAKRFALGQSQPLLATPVKASQQGRSSFLAVDPWQDVIITSLRPSRDGQGQIVRLFNASDEAQTVRLSGPCNVYLSSPAEEQGDHVQAPLPLAPRQIVTLRME